MDYAAMLDKTREEDYPVVPLLVVPPPSSEIFSVAEVKVSPVKEVVLGKTTPKGNSIEEDIKEDKGNIKGNINIEEDIKENIEENIEEDIKKDIKKNSIQENLIEENLIEENSIEENSIKESLIEESPIEESLIEESLIKKSSMEEDISVAAYQRKFDDEPGMETQTSTSSEEPEPLATPEIISLSDGSDISDLADVGSGVFGDSLDKIFPVSDDSTLPSHETHETHEKSGETEKSEKNGDRDETHDKIHDENHGNDSEKYAMWRSAEREALHLAQQMQDTEPMRRVSPLYRRSGFRGNRGRFLVLCAFSILIIGTLFTVYHHWKRNSYDFLMGEALTFYGQEQYEAAFEMYQRVVGRYAGRIEPLLGTARAAEHIGRVEDAVAAYQASLKFFSESEAPARSGVFYEIGRLYSSLKAWDKAQSSFKEAAAIDPTSYSVYFALAIVLEEQDDLQAASEAYSRMLDLSPSSDVARKAIRRISLILAAREEEQKVRAVTQKFEQAMREGTAALELKKYEDASRYFSEALSVYSNDVNAWIGFADARNELGDRAGAIKSLQRALTYQPDHDEAKTKLAELEVQNRRRQPPKRNTSPRSFRRNTRFQAKPVANKVASAVSPVFSVSAVESVTREGLFNEGVDHYREGNYSQAFEMFLACLSFEGNGDNKNNPLPSGSLAGDVGPLWKDFQTILNVPSEARLLAEAVYFNPVDRSLYVNLSMAGAKMGIDRKTLRTALERVHLHALERQ
ncbi:MAG: tetratricopeptide repeat protein [Synergistaceae bacterium]|jgi:tetratricopeptide (TPR) repeat protein|nr:tetratricopeptide repeat protein [Synergistaceae bacterium]